MRLKFLEIIGWQQANSKSKQIVYFARAFLADDGT